MGERGVTTTSIIEFLATTTDSRRRRPLGIAVNPPSALRTCRRACRLRVSLKTRGRC